MSAFRRLLAQPYLAVLLCAAALMAKLLVPAGYMIGSDHGHVAITLCSGFATPSAAMDMPGMHGDPSDHGRKDTGKAEMPCAFASAAGHAIAAVDPVLLVTLIAFVIARGTAPAVPLGVRSRSYLRPPLRGPPSGL